MKPVRYDAGKLRGLLRPQQMTSYDDNSRPVPEYLLVTHARHGQFRNFAAQFNRDPIPPASNPCCNPGLKISVVLSL
jgi:hypothetical protein